jgi:hypothetical protein
MANSDKCAVCGSSDGNLKSYGVTVDGEALSMQPVLCEEHGTRFIIRAGALFASLDVPIEQVFKNWGVGRPGRV